MNIEKLQKWFNSQTKWFNFGANILINRNKLNDEELNVAVDICMNTKKAETKTVDINAIIKGGENHSLRIDSIENIKGVFGLAPKKALQFAKGNLSIIYGRNGSGKSSYVRLLKNICNSRTKEKILGNIYKDNEEEPSATVKYTFDGEQGKICDWNKDSQTKELEYVDIYDTDYESLFLKEADTVTYEPPLLAYFTRLSKFVDDVHNKVSSKKDSFISKLPVMPAQFQSTEEYHWYKTLTKNIIDNDIKIRTTFEKADEDKLADINSRLNTKDISAEISKVGKQIQYVQEIIKTIENFAQNINISKSRSIFDLKKIVDKTKKISDDAQKIFNNSDLEGVGSESWKELWKAARNYSENYAYKGQNYPYVSENARCVLCHQILNDEAKKRMVSFESYIQGAAEKEYQKAVQVYQNALQQLPEIKNLTERSSVFNAAGFDDEFQKKLNIIFEGFIQAEEKIKNNGILDNNVKIEDAIRNLQKFEEGYQQKLADLSKTEDERNKLEKEVLSLSARKWLHENKNAVVDEIERLKKIAAIDEILKTVNTRSITMEKAELSQTLVTEEFVERFNKELEKLHVKVSVGFIDGKPVKGKITHSIILKNAKKNAMPADVLSEGEYRIVSIAAFFADVLGRNGSIPFVFDDPISSLDADYENLVARRLVELSNERQIIVFTHRLTFLCSLTECLENVKDKNPVVSISSEHWGKGEPSRLPINVSKPQNVLNELINNKIPEAKKIAESDGSAACYDKIRSLCSDFRNIVERLVETNLINGVVERFNRNIKTLNKIEELSKINMNDCKLFEKMMTKYSYDDHSQAYETPAQMISLDEILADAKEMQDWIKEFHERKVQN